jgi:hypothetical protein
MVREIKVPADQIKVNGDQIEVNARLGPGQILDVTFRVQDTSVAADPATKPLDEWERELEEIVKLAPVNPYPIDDSREAMYGPDPGEDEST